jgi:pyruvate ferredoxin oxidoreductase beta subunit
MNTGIQRSSATPIGASTTTDPAGTVRPGKLEFRKDLTAIVAAHHIPYVAQASIHNLNDFLTKVKIAIETEGPSFINVLSPCVLGWGYDSSQTIELAKLAVETCFWPLYEVKNDNWILNYDPGDKKKPVIEFMKSQKRFKHLFKPENEWVLKRAQEEVDKRWEWLKRMCEK